MDPKENILSCILWVCVDSYHKTSKATQGQYFFVEFWHPILHQRCIGELCPWTSNGVDTP